VGLVFSLDIIKLAPLENKLDIGWLNCEETMGTRDTHGFAFRLFQLVIDKKLNAN